MNEKGLFLNPGRLTTPSFTGLPARGPIIGYYPLMLLPHAGLNGGAPLGQSVGPITTPEGRWGAGRGLVEALHCVFVRSGDEVWISLFSLSHFDLTPVRDS